MPRPVWTGTISFGLVSVPVKAYTAARDHTIRFNQIERATGARVRQRMVSEQTGEEVEREDIVLGYEVADGRYVTFERDELDELRPQSTKAIEVRDFVDLDEVDPIYFQRTYWLGPDGDAASQPYALLLAAMQERNRVAIGSVVMRNKQYLTALRPLDGALAMSTMRFADEVVDHTSIDEVPDQAEEADPKALALAVQIVDSLTGEWDPAQYSDSYSEELREIIAKRAEGQTIEVAEGDEPRSAKVLDLMAALKASLEASKGGDADDDAPAKASGKKAPAKKAAAKKSAAKKAPAKKSAARRAAAKKGATKKKPAAKKSA